MYKVIYSEDLSETADSIETIPNSNNLFTCGTYQLVESETSNEKSSSHRVGTLKLYEIDENDVVQNLQNITQNAILDMKWKPNNSNENILTVADSCGRALYYNLNEKHLEEKAILEIDSESLCLSTDWSKFSTQVAYSMSSGEIIIVEYSNSSPVILNKWKGHSLEAWIVATDGENLLYTGADDCLLKQWDKRMGFDRATFTSKQHTMGVCSVQAHKHQPHIFVSGSYDETICIWDHRVLKRPLNEISVGGGVWRLKWRPYSNMLLAACMHDGFKVVQYNDSLNESSMICHYDEHNSLAYGTDWINVGDDLESIKGSLLASCSFYDKLLTVWRVT